MTDEQRKRMHVITYSTEDRVELAERIVALEDERNKLRELLAKREYDIERLQELVSQLQTDLEVEFDCSERMEDKEEMYKAENERLRELLCELYEDQCDEHDRWKYRDRMRELGIEVEDD